MTSMRAKPRSRPKRASSQHPPICTERDHALAVLRELKTVMLLTAGRGEDLREVLARPETVVHHGSDGSLWFVTVGDGEHDPRAGIAHITCQSSTRFVSIAGTYAVSRDPAELACTWSTADEPWLLAGRADPQRTVLKVRPEVAELWDCSGAKGLRYAFDLGSALFDPEPLLDPEPAQSGGYRNALLKLRLH